MESIPALVEGVSALSAPPRWALPCGFGTVHLESGDHVGGYLRVTEGLVVCWLKKPDASGNTCKVWPWWRVSGVDLVEDE